MQLFLSHKFRGVVLIVLCLGVAAPVYAATPTDHPTQSKARITQIVSQVEEPLGGSSAVSIIQHVKAELIDGAERGTIVVAENDVQPVVVGDTVYLTHTVDSLDNVDMYTVSELYRLPQLGYLALLFLVVLLCFGGLQGIRGLFSLGVSILFIAYVLLPGVIGGYPALLVTVGVAGLIIIVGSYVTHGFTRVTTSAVVGMVATIIVTGGIAFVAMQYLRLTGFASEEAVYLNLGTAGTIDFAGLLLGGILIGLLGVLYDAAIGQAVAVDELYRARPDAERAYVYKRALRIGREHIGALVNTLAIAYVGVSLPLLLLFYSSAPEASLSFILNRELFVTELTRMMIGGIGIILAVPVTTAIAVWFLEHTSKKKGFEPHKSHHSH